MEIPLQSENCLPSEGWNPRPGARTVCKLVLKLALRVVAPCTLVKVCGKNTMEVFAVQRRQCTHLIWFPKLYGVFFWFFSSSNLCYPDLDSPLPDEIPCHCSSLQSWVRNTYAAIWKPLDRRKGSNNRMDPPRRTFIQQAFLITTARTLSEIVTRSYMQGVLTRPDSLCVTVQCTLYRWSCSIRCALNLNMQSGPNFLELLSTKICLAFNVCLEKNRITNQISTCFAG